MSGVDGITGWIGTVLGAGDPVALASFYAGLLGGELDEQDPAFVTLHQPGTTSYLGFQLEPGHTPPTWPAGAGDQQMQLHLDVGVRDVPAAVDQAVALGAREAEQQPQEDVRVMVDPAGHPFCLYRDRD